MAVLRHEEIFQKYLPMILSLIKNSDFLNYGIEADDLLQEIKIKIWRYINKTREPEKPGAYVRKIVNCVIIDQIAAARKENSAWQAGCGNFLVGNGFSRDRISSSLPLLKESRRIVISLYLQGYDAKEISEILKWSRAKTYYLMRQGKRELRSILKNED